MDKSHKGTDLRNSVPPSSMNEGKGAPSTDAGVGGGGREPLQTKDGEESLTTGRGNVFFPRSANEPS